MREETVFELLLADADNAVLFDQWRVEFTAEYGVDPLVSLLRRMRHLSICEAELRAGRPQA